MTKIADYLEDMTEGKPKLIEQETAAIRALLDQNEFEDSILPETRIFTGELETEDENPATFNFSAPAFEFENNYVYSLRLKVLVIGEGINEFFILESLYRKESDLITKVTDDDFEITSETLNLLSLGVITAGNNELNTIDIICRGVAETALKWKFLLEWTKIEIIQE